MNCKYCSTKMSITHKEDEHVQEYSIFWWCPGCGTRLGQHFMYDYNDEKPEKRYWTQPKNKSLIKLAKAVKDVQCNFPQWWYELEYNKLVNDIFEPKSEKIK